jgi:hypothetical protein
MPQPPPQPGMLPPWLVVAGSAAILVHFAAVVIPILDMPSGPWATPVGRTVDDPPAFAHAARNLADWHGQYLRLANSYHFTFNRPGDAPAVEMEVRLKDDTGKVFRTLKFPDPAANPWLRHRQELMARALAPDLPVDPPGQEVLGGVGQRPPTLAVWLTPEDRVPGAAAAQTLAFLADPSIHLRLAAVPLHLIPRGRGVMRPSEWSVLLAQSYARGLCREYGAEKAEIIRHTQEPISPSFLFGQEPSQDAFDELLASFGEVSR